VCFTTRNVKLLRGNPWCARGVHHGHGQLFKFTLVGTDAMDKDNEELIQEAGSDARGRGGGAEVGPVVDPVGTPQGGTL
jgi:hypothetical protein